MQYGRYRIVRELGKGSMGVVYQAHDPQIDRMVALKVLRPDKVASEPIVQRFLKEAKAIGRLSHPNIVVVYDIGEDHDTVYISMEYIEGKPLKEIIKTRKVEIEEVINLGIQVADGLDYAHRRGIVHRDVKPSNILVQQDGKVKITDFGIARIEDPDVTHHTVAGEILGTPAYMSPEQVLGQPVDGRSDLFSLGVILYEMVAGVRPFQGESLATIFRSITDDDPRQAVESNPHFPRDFSNVVLKALAKDPLQRYGSCGDLRDALRVCMTPEATLAWPPPPGHSQRPGRPRKGPMLLLGLLVLAAGAAGAVYYVRSHPAPPGAVETQKKGGQDSTPEVASNELSRDSSPLLGSLRLDSSPSGAAVTIDEEARGRTPMEIKLPVGPHEVRLSLDRYGDWEARVKVVEDRVTPIPAELMPIQ